MTLVKKIDADGGVYSKYHVVHPKGFEPPTFGTGNQRSIQLSYGCLVMRQTSRFFSSRRQNGSHFVGLLFSLSRTHRSL